ncbi:MAG: hypothetical protein RIS70_4254, partial [Planctomycetota bacterium]
MDEPFDLLRNSDSQFLLKAGITMSESITYLGIDLGSFKTSVTSSNGRRHSLQTAVGWPKDHIARAMLGRDVVFGTELREQRLALDIV